MDVINEGDKEDAVKMAIHVKKRKLEKLKKSKCFTDRGRNWSIWFRKIWNGFYLMIFLI